MTGYKHLGELPNLSEPRYRLPIAPVGEEGCVLGGAEKI